MGQRELYLDNDVILKIDYIMALFSHYQFCPKVQLSHKLTLAGLHDLSKFHLERKLTKISWSMLVKVDIIISDNILGTCSPPIQHNRF